MVDMGNSSIKWATWEQNRLSVQQRIPYQTKNFEKTLTQAWLMLNAPSQGVWISNVAGLDKAKIITHWVTTHWGFKPTFIKTSASKCGVKNGYKNPEQLGVDRWLALIGAYHLEKGRLCVVDCGTAITVDLLLANGHHQGGLIIPGTTTMHRALLNDTYALAQFNKTLLQHGKKTFLAHETHTGITLGTLYAVVGFLEYVLNVLEQQGSPLKLILTGGSVPALESFLQRPYQYISDLVLQGLVTIVNQSL